LHSVVVLNRVLAEKCELDVVPALELEVLMAQGAATNCVCSVLPLLIPDSEGELQYRVLEIFIQW
jgi:hypothetical protein